MQDAVKTKLPDMVRQIFLTQWTSEEFSLHLQLCDRGKNVDLRLSDDHKVHIIGKIMDEGCPLPDMETIFHNLHGAGF